MTAEAGAMNVGALSGTFSKTEGPARGAGIKNFVKIRLCSMRAPAAIALVSLALVSASAGYLLRAQKTDGALVLSVRDVVQEEYLVAPDSYSRVENTKNTLDGLCTRVRLGIEEATATYERLAKNGETSNRQAAVVLERAIRDAETAVREFEGTEQQLDVVQDLLRLLERSGRFDLWTRFYLKALYERPTHQIVSHFASEAVRISKLAGQQKQVLDALRYLAAVPAEFAGRAEIEAALDTVQPSFAQVAGQ
jgi:hypothetical protein